LLGVLGLIWIVYSVREIHLAYASRDWPKTEGTVAAVSAKAVDPEDRREHAAPEITTPVWFRISYQYPVEGATYTGDRVYAGHWLPVSDFGARELRARYPRAAKVQVSYDPARPGVSVLEPGFDDYFLATLAAGYVVLLVSIFVMYSKFKTPGA
jgi:hypothetical protein